MDLVYNYQNMHYIDLYMVNINNQLFIIFIMQYQNIINVKQEGTTQHTISKVQVNSSNKRLPSSEKSHDQQKNQTKINEMLINLENADKLKKQYYDFFKTIISDPEKYIPEMPDDKEFKQHKIKYLKGRQFQQKSYHQPSIRVKNTQRQGTIVVYTVIISMFELQITLLNIDQDAKVQSNKIGKGSYGSVRIQTQNKRMFAVKRQMFTNRYNMKEFNMMANKYEIEQAIKQLGIYKICSLLKIGPAAETDIGFDLICYRDCIQFQIQYCLKIEYRQKNDYKIGIYVDETRFEKQIKQCLLTLHSYRIIHKDIKPANILFSIKYNKYVLTDFGISHPVIEKIGYRSQTGREGTHNYMSKEMKKIEKSKGHVHLYGNDVHSLSVVLKQKMENLNLQEQIILIKQSKQYMNLEFEYEYLKLKYYCIKPNSQIQEVQLNWRFMDIDKLNQLIGIVDSSIQYDKICKVYNYLSKQQKYKDIKLDSLRIQSQTIKNIKIDPNIKQNTQLQLKNMLRAYGYSLQVRQMIMKLKLQQKYKDTVKMIDKVVSDKDYQKYNEGAIMLGNYRNYIKKVKKQLQKFQQQKNNSEVFKRYMIILQYGDLIDQLDIIQKLNKFKYKRKQVEKIEQMIRVNVVEMNKDKLKKFELWQNQGDQQRDHIISSLDLYSQVGKIFQNMGKKHKALIYYQKKLKMSSDRENLSSILAACTNRAIINTNMGKHELALTQYNQILKTQILLYGQQHPAIAITYYNIGGVYHRMYNYDTSLRYYTKSLNMDISFYGKQHPNVARTYNNIASIYNEMAKYETALTYYNKSLNIFISFHGQQHPSIATTYSNIAYAYNHMNKYEIALQYYYKCLNINLLFHGQHHPNIASVYDGIAHIYDSMGNYETALTNYFKSLNIHKLSFYGQKSHSIATICNNIGRLYGKIRQYKPALTYYMKSAYMFLQLYGQQHSDVALNYHNCAICYFSLGQLIQAQKYVFKSMKIKSDYFLTSLNYDLLSKILLKKNKIIKSLYYAFLAVNTFLKFNPIDHPKSRVYLLSLAQIYYQMNRFIQSYFFYRLSCQILVRYFTINNIDAQQAKQRMNEMEWSMPQSIHNYISNIQFMNNISNKYSQLPKYKLMKILLAKKRQLKFEYIHRGKRDSSEYLKCVIEIYLCYKYLSCLKQMKKVEYSMKVEFQRLKQSQQKSMFKEFIFEICHKQ